MKITKELSEVILDPKFKSLSGHTLGKLLKISQSTVSMVRKTGSYEAYKEWIHNRDRKKSSVAQPASKNEQTSAKTDDGCPFKIGGKYFFRTVTYFVTGRVVAIHGKFLELADGAWIADTGRFADALQSGDFSEVEPVEVPMFLNTDSVTDAFVWAKDLPRNQK